MNVKNNKRRKESQNKIEKAFVELLQNREINEISVSDIIKLTGLNRSTFYANYLDIYDLADKIQADLENEVTRILYQEIDWMKSENDFLKLFKHIKENQDLYRFYFKLGYENKKLKLYDIYDLKVFDDTEMLDYHIEFFKNGFNAIIKLWLEKGCVESPEKMCEVLLSEYKGRFE